MSRVSWYALCMKLQLIASVCVVGLVASGGVAKPVAAGPGAAVDGKQTAAAELRSIGLRAEAIAAKAAAYLISQQDKASGGWAVPKAGTQQPHLPAVTALAVTGMSMTLASEGAGVMRDKAAIQEAVAAGAKYILSHRKADGGIYDAILPTYNTAIGLSALARIDTAEAKAAIGPAQEFLKRSQWGVVDPVGVGGAGGKEAPKPAAEIGPDHPFYGGIGYGNRGRPDLSNLAFTVQAWHDSGLSVDDEAYKRAIVFMQRCQMLPEVGAGAGAKAVNDQAYAKGSQQGGFIYATAENDKTVGQGQSFAGTIEETMDNGEKVSKLRAYGSMTYAGFKSYLYAGLTAEDPRVAAAFDWSMKHWTLQENPGIGTDGYYYFLVMFARAMDARGEAMATVVSGEAYRSSLVLRGLKAGVTADELKAAFAGQKENGCPEATHVVMVGTDAATRFAVVYLKEQDKVADAQRCAAAIRSAGLFERAEVREQPPGDGGKVDWRAALIERLEAMQQADGSFATVDDRWMENNPSLTTAYALVALEHARKGLK